MNDSKNSENAGPNRSWHLSESEIGFESVQTIEEQYYDEEFAEMMKKKGENLSGMKRRQDYGEKVRKVNYAARLMNSIKN